MKIKEINAELSGFYPKPDSIWQFDVLPIITIQKTNYLPDNIFGDIRYVKIHFGWLFWTYCITVYYE